MTQPSLTRPTFATALHHVGMAVKSIDEQLSHYVNILGGTLEYLDSVPDQHVRVASVLFGASRIELVEPAGPNSVIAKFIHSRGEGLHHVAYTVADLRQCIADLQEAGYAMVNDLPRRGAHGCQIAFVHPKSTFGVLTELCQVEDAHIVNCSADL